MENMTKYELIKDLPTFKKGEVFVLMGTGLHRYSDGLMAYTKATLDKYPNILEEWFREVDLNGRWEPKEGDKYWYVQAYGIGPGVSLMAWDNDGIDQEASEIGNVFRTKEDAKKAIEWLKARKVLFDDANGFKPNWKDDQEYKWSVVWDGYGIYLFADFCFSEASSPGPYFATKEDAKASIKAHEKDWKIYLGVEE